MTVYLQVDVACRVLYKRHVKKGHWQSFLLQVFFGKLPATSSLLEDQEDQILQGPAGADT